MKVILKREFDETLERDWKLLEKKNNLIIFQTYDWNKNWIEFNNSEFKIMTFVVYSESKPIAIFPFYKKKKFFFNILKWIGNDISDYLGPIVDKDYLVEKKIFDKIWDEITLKTKFECDLIYLNKQSSHKTLFYNPITNFLNCVKYNSNYGINLLKWNLLIKDKNKSIQQYRSKRKKLSSLGNLKFTYNIEDLEDKKQLIYQMIEWKKNTKKKQNFINTFDDKFYSDFIKKENVLISAIKLNDKFIAGILGLKFKNDYYFLLPSYRIENETFKLSPGRILLIDLINFLYEKKFNFFNFCDGNQSYKQEWSNEKIDLKVYLKSNNLKGYLLKILLRFLIVK